MCTLTLSWGHSDFSSGSSTPSSYRVSVSPSVTSEVQLWARHDRAGAGPHRWRRSVCLCVQDVDPVVVWSVVRYTCVCVFVLGRKSSCKNWDSVFSISTQVSLSDIASFRSCLAWLWCVSHRCSTSANKHPLSLQRSSTQLGWICVSYLLSVTHRRRCEQIGN